MNFSEQQLEQHLGTISIAWGYAHQERSQAVWSRVHASLTGQASMAQLLGERELSEDLHLLAEIAWKNYTRLVSQEVVR